MNKDKTKEKRAGLMERINEDVWNDELWVVFNDECNDSSDSGAIKDMNKLAMRWDRLDAQKRESMNEAFIIACGWSFDSLLARADGRAEG